MSNKLVVVEGCQLAFRNPQAQGVIQILPTSCPMSSGGKKAYNGQLNFVVTGYTVGQFAQSTPCPGAIPGTSQKAFSQGLAFVLNGDSVQVVVQGIENGSPSSKTDEVYVANPGQNVLKVT